MSVVRVDVNKCTGCRNCVEICPMDVFYFNEQAHKSVIAYPENCQSCGQCYVNCEGRAIGITNDAFAFPIMPIRGVSKAPMNRTVITEPGVIKSFTGGALAKPKEE